MSPRPPTPSGKASHRASALGRSALWALLCWTLAAAPGGRAVAEPARSLRHVVYDYAVTSYCGLLTPEVEFGFQRELAALTERSGLSADEAKDLRIAGWVDADREWSNRGLGGYRAWCVEEGLPAAQRFLLHATQD